MILIAKELWQKMRWAKDNKKWLYLVISDKMYNGDEVRLGEGEGGKMSDIFFV